MTKTGWWSVSFDLTLEGEEVRWDDLDEATQEHIVQMIFEGYRQGEIVEETDGYAEGDIVCISMDYDLYDEEDNPIRFDGKECEIVHINRTNGTVTLINHGEESDAKIILSAEEFEAAVREV